jgi:hypothetical protein
LANLFGFASLFLFAGGLYAQDIHPPVLHHRGDPVPSPQTQAEIHGTPVLPDDASGEYGFGEPGEVIQIILEPQGRLTGYISKFGDHDSDRGAPLTLIFRHTSVSGEQIQFETGTIHGVWFAFHGSILRGVAKSRSEEGYFHLVGTLEEHDVAAGTLQKRNVDLKLSKSL